MVLCVKHSVFHHVKMGRFVLSQVFVDVVMVTRDQDVVKLYVESSVRIEAFVTNQTSVFVPLDIRGSIAKQSYVPLDVLMVDLVLVKTYVPVYLATEVIDVK